MYRYISRIRYYISERIDDRKDSYKNCFKLNFKKFSSIKRSHSIKKTSYDYDGYVYCIEVPSGAIITRNPNNCNTFITGNCHGLFGQKLINIIRVQYPEWFDDNMEEMITSACFKAYKAERKLLDWILEKGEPEFLSKHTIDHYIRNRFNNSLRNIGYDPVFIVDEKEIEKTEWMDLEMQSHKEFDFFYKTSVAYNKHNKSITEDDLF